MIAIPPAWVLFAAALALPWLSPRGRTFVILAAPIAVLSCIWALSDGVHWSTQFLGHELSPLRADRLSRLFGTVFAIMAFAGGLFAFRQARTRELCAAFTYAGGSLGVVFAGDLLTLFVYWELMALGSTAVLWCSGTAESYRAGLRYLVVHLLGGVLLMVGIVGFAMSTGTVHFGSMTALVEANHWAGWLILAGFLLNAGAPPLSAWLPDAYPEASPAGTVFLSAFTTKTAVFVLMWGFPGTGVLIYLGLYMIFYGILYALLENDIRRILAYSIVNQVGFMVCGIGIGTELALNGAAAHAFTHIIYKALLLMSAGSVLYMTGKRKCTDVGGLFQSMPVTALCGIIGALAISAFPLTSGFISKSMISQASADEHLAWVWLGLAAASAGVFLHAGIKFPWFVFFQRDSGLRPPDPPWNMQAAMILFAVACILLGLIPGPLYAILPYPVDYVPYTWSHVLTQLQLLLFSGLAFFVMLPQMRRTLTISLDFDWFYRRGTQSLIERLSPMAIAAKGALTQIRDTVANAVRTYIENNYSNRRMAAVWSTGTMTVWILALLSAWLLLYL